MSLPTDNPMLRTDSYKASHFLQYPPGTTRLLGYLSSALVRRLGRALMAWRSL